MRQRKITPEQLLQKVSAFDPKTETPEKEEELHNSLVDYVSEVFNESTTIRDQEVLPERKLHYLVLDLFFTFARNSVFFQQKKKLSGKISDSFKLSDLDLSKDDKEILKKYKPIDFFIDALSKCENIFYFLENSENLSSLTKDEIDFFF